MTEPPAPTATGLYAQQQHAPGTVLAGRFRIEAMLGIGGMGVVYRATDTVLDTPVALKLLRAELASRTDAFERFRQELLMARQVSSPHVVRIHDLSKHEQAGHEGQWLISMDYVDGEGLDRLIDREGALPVEQALHIAGQLAEGLAAAHARGVVHRDLKPANVLIDRDGNAYISDFGVARSLATSGLTHRSTAAGAVVGTPDYLSPEQARGEGADARSDLYALGLILYEMLTGDMPFPGGTVGEVLAQRMVRSPPAVTRARPQIPAWVARLVDRLLRPKPGHRLQSAQAVIRAIERREVPREFRVGRRFGLALAATLAVAVLGAAGLWWSQRDGMPALASVPALERLVLLPIESPDALPPARAAALGAALHQVLSQTSGLAVVDLQRGHQALRQLDPTGAARIDPSTLQRVVAADRSLRVQLLADGTEWEARAILLAEQSSPRTVSAQGPTAGAALSALVAAPGFVQLLGLPPQTLTLELPPPSSLDAFGSALLARRSDDLEEALALAQQATASAPGFIPGWLLLADIARASGRTDIAFAAIEDAQRSATGAQPVLRQRLLAERAMLEGDLAAATAHWRALLEDTPDDTFAELNLARALGAGGDVPGAIEQLGVLTARDPNDARAWFELGKFSIMHGDIQRAVDDYLLRALVLNRRSGNRHGEAEAVNAIGIGYARLGQIDAAGEQYRKAIELRDTVGDRRGLANSLCNLANVLSLQGEFDSATGLLERARGIHVEIDDTAGMAAIENELGLIAEESGDYPAALAAFQRALRVWQQVDDPHGIARTLNDIAFAHYQLGDYDDAQAYWVQAAQAYAELGDQTGRVRTRQNLGLLAIARGQWKQARTDLEASLASAEQQQMLEETAVSRRNLAELELLQGHLAAAIEHAGKAEALFAGREDRRGLAEAGLLRVRALLAAHADASAREALRGLQPAIADGSAEHQAMAQLLQAQLAGRAGNASARDRALTRARMLAKQSGVELLQLKVALHDHAGQPALAQRVATLGHFDLRMHWTRQAMQRAIADGHPEAAAKLYQEVLPLLRRGDYIDAWRLHRLGATALVASGDDVAATDARHRADAALAPMRARLPESLRDGFERAVAREAGA